MSGVGMQSHFAAGARSYLVVSVSQLLHATGDAFTVIQRAGRDAFEVGLNGIPSLLVLIVYVASRVGDMKVFCTLGRDACH
ncbi:hypothetical protein PMIT1306_00367 [Prochlorococcus sp. MIT 1306]|nr:hypothetical protein PMIT1306_00367 [Prochlorococcus sp. MIT 1306]